MCIRRGDRTRTCGLMLPKHAIYQLIYTPWSTPIFMCTIQNVVEVNCVCRVGRTRTDNNPASKAGNLSLWIATRIVGIQGIEPWLRGPKPRVMSHYTIFQYNSYPTRIRTLNDCTKNSSVTVTPSDNEIENIRKSVCLFFPIKSWCNSYLRFNFCGQQWTRTTPLRTRFTVWLPYPNDFCDPSCDYFVLGNVSPRWKFCLIHILLPNCA